MIKTSTIFFLIVFLVSCSGINEERTTGTFIEDFSIERKINKFINKDYELDALTNVKATSYNEVLLLTGQIPNERLRQENKENPRFHDNGGPQLNDIEV